MMPTLLSCAGTLLAAWLAGGVATSAFSVPTGLPVFTAPLDITNTFSPFEPGAIQVFTGTEGGKARVIVVQQLPDTRFIGPAGFAVECRVQQETEFAGGVLARISDTYLAQSDDGSVWSFGQLVENYEGGVLVSHAGSWLLGGGVLPTDPINTASAGFPGIVMPATPAVGDTFKPANVASVADESDEVIAAGKSVKVKAGKFTGCLRIKASDGLQGGAATTDWAPGVGLIRIKGPGRSLQLSATTLAPVAG